MEIPEYLEYVRDHVRQDMTETERRAVMYEYFVRYGKSDTPDAARAWVRNLEFYLEYRKRVEKGRSW